MKIAYLITRMDEYGGAQVHVRDLSLWLKGQGHEVAVIAGTSGRITDFLEEQGVEFLETPELERAIHPLKDWKAFLQIRAALKKFQPDILSCHSSKAGLLGRLAARSLGIKVVFTAHGWAFTEGVPAKSRFIYRSIEKLAGPFSDHIITVSDYDRQLALKAEIAPPDKITTVHNGMPMRPLTRGHRNGATRIIMVARIAIPKDYDLLIQALTKITDMQWTLDIIGGGDDTDLRQLVKDLGLDERVNFLGERNDVPELMENKADIYCLISKWEGLPRSILEAMRAGLPVIASNVGGVAECVENGQTGYLVEAQNIEELSHTLRLVIPDAGLQQQLGRNGRRKFEEEFTFLAMAQKTFAIYHSVLQSVSPAVDKV